MIITIFTICFKKIIIDNFYPKNSKLKSNSVLGVGDAKTWRDHIVVVTNQPKLPNNTAFTYPPTHQLFGDEISGVMWKC